jgi:hypothetical protein
MAERDTIFKGKLKQGGIFIFKDFYNFVYDWLREENYDLFETGYTEKVKGDAKQVEIKWDAHKEISDYFKFAIELKWLILGMKTVEVMKNGKKVKMDSGLLEIKFKSMLVKDYENRWEDHPFWKFLRGFYDRYIIRSRIDDYEIRLLEETDELISQCKAFLAISGQHT